MIRTAYAHYYLVGIKGVAMTSLAQILLDAHCAVSGCDTAEDFVTKKQLDSTHIQVDIGFSHPVPAGIDCVIYTAAHQGIENPVVQNAVQQGIPIFSQAEALAAFFNDKQGIAVCGVGGKSTTAAMITWILEKTGKSPSFSVGVGEIKGLDHTGCWNTSSQYFVAEADEYASNPTEMKKGAPLVPRFQFLTPTYIVCTNIAYDHPDVYSSIEQTRQVFTRFFEQLKPNGVLFCSEKTRAELQLNRADIQFITCGAEDSADYQYSITSPEAYAAPQVHIHDRKNNQSQQLQMLVPGPHNVMNATYAIATCAALGITIAESCKALASFASTKRRFEFMGEKNGVLFYDDYAHHPSEIAMVIATLKKWFPGKRGVIAFQSHTFSRTKQLFSEFVEVLSQADEVVMIDIFASAREAFDETVSSDSLCAALHEKAPQLAVKNVHTLENLAEFLTHSVSGGSVCVTVGAGDIYKVHDSLH